MAMDIHSFSPGPAPLPKEVLDTLSASILNTFGTGESILEISHRSPAYVSLNEETLDLAKTVLEIPPTHRPLITPLGAQHLFSMIPAQISKAGDVAAYAKTGVWAALALKEAERLGRQVHVLFAGGPDFVSLGDPHQWAYPKELEVKYCHLTVNNTVYGLEFPQGAIPTVGDAPLVLDMTSALGARTDIPWENAGVVYGSFQKNLGIAGASIVIVRDDLLSESESYAQTNGVGHAFTFSACEAAKSALNTPPVFAIYVFNKMLRWVQNQGGLAAAQERALAKSAQVYGIIDGGFYKGRAQTSHRSRHNIVFHLPTAQLDSQFIVEAKRHQIIEIKGYRHVGGIRVSVYNGVPFKAIETLVDFMEDFRRRYG